VWGGMWCGGVMGVVWYGVMGVVWCVVWCGTFSEKKKKMEGNRMTAKKVYVAHPPGYKEQQLIRQN
jgi:hypothetical protein